MADVRKGPFLGAAMVGAAAVGAVAQTRRLLKLHEPCHRFGFALAVGLDAADQGRIRPLGTRVGDRAGILQKTAQTQQGLFARVLNQRARSSATTCSAASRPAATSSSCSCGSVRVIAGTNGMGWLSLVEVAGRAVHLHCRTPGK